MQHFCKALAESLEFEDIIAAIKCNKPIGGAGKEDIELAALAFFKEGETIGTI